MTEMRKDRRAPASLKVKYKSATVDDFIEQFGTDVSRGGIFIKTKKPLEAGALLKFEFQLQDGSAVLHGVGRVAWRRLEQQARPDLPAGMGIKFFKLSDHSRVVVERIESRYTGNKSRYELTDAAEFAPPLSGPPAAESGASPLPGNGRRPLGSGSGPLTMPPPPALSSIPPALADVPARPGPPPPPRVPGRTASGNVLPKGTMGGSFFPETQPRKSGSPQSRSRDTSEFLASAFQAGGAGPEVRAAARAQAERARRDPESIDLGRELFGDLGDVASPPPPLLQQPRQPSGPARAPSGPARSPSGSGALSFGDVTPHETPTHRPPPSDDAQDAFNLSTPIPAATLPRGAGSSKPSLAERIPSIEQLVDEASGPDLQAPSASSQRAARDSGGSASGPRTPQPSAASAAPAEERAEGHPPLTLAISVPTGTQSVQPGESPGRSRLLLFVALASTIVLGGVAVYIAMQRGGAAAPAESPAEVATAPTPTPEPAPQPATQPEQPPAAAAAEPTPAPTAEPAPPAGPEVPVVIQSKPRGAEVWIGDKSQGTAPVTLKLPSGAPIEISVRSAGYATVTRAITPAEKAAPESFELAPLPFQLVIHTEPEGAVIATTKNRVVSPAPLDLGHLESIINVSIEKEGFQKTTRAVRVDEFREESGVMRAELSLSLTPLPAAAARRRPVRAAAPTAAPSDAPPEPGETAPSAPPVMQVKPEGESHTADPAPAEPPPEAKAKPLEPAPEKPAAAPPAEPAPAAPAN